ncbi:MAG: diacylglycerol kinase family protein [Polyangiaceae bacterium]
MSGIGVILNPRSRRNLRDPRAAGRLAKQLGDHGVVRLARSIDELRRIAEDFKKLDIDVLGISGGDGTNHVTITGFIDVYDGSALPRLAFLRGGTMNTVANSVGVGHGKPEGLLGKLIRAYAARAAQPLLDVERHVLKIAPADPTSDRGSATNYGFLFGTGVVYGYLAEYYRGGEPSPLVAAKTLARGVGSTIVGGEMIARMAKPFRGSVTVHGNPRGGVDDDRASRTWPERDYLAVAAGTIDQIGLGFKPFYRYGEQPNAFHILGIHTTAMGLVRELGRVHRGEAMDEGKTYEAVAEKATVRSADGTMRYMIDGDLHSTRGEVELSVGPRVKILVGN